MAALALLLPLQTAPPASATPAAALAPTLSLSAQQAGKGGTLTVTGSGWRPKTLLTLLICGQNMIGGTNACANGAGRAVTTGPDGTFRKEIPVAEPPKPCPCVVHAATVTGAPAAADAPFTVAGHPVAPLPQEDAGGRLSVLAPPRLEGSSGLLTWFGAPPQRRLVITVGNLGATPAKDPVFEVGTSHGVYAPQWEERQWQGTVPAGRRQRIELPVELPAGAHGDYLVSLKYGGKVLAEQPWGVGRPWGVTLFWILLCVVVPAAVFRIGMVVVDRVRPREGAARTPGGAARTPGSPLRTPERAHRKPGSALRNPLRMRRRAPAPDAAPPPAGPAATLPWFTPDTAPSATTSDPADPPRAKGPT
ncbi:hypothetical protein SRIM_016050 [Streptomyces rimosus subsp. rimosus ATCC 10970]|uniref:Neocarzinostatin family protein n=1 Tax=Streptomyces rimosus subsp. rimosus (strain ATCC 10970 / DSM 40260 / JCM 4667 / NRRL 2234) TaxID=1265868 RepID=A0A8A1V4N7_STRR1|nr:hypothetical protein [Streptomyces sp. SID5471]QDA09786.1 hypothetical protein CTZ40_24810 [Streptomyces rimosus]QGY71081.1 hypothetical protein V519_000255 [Streptomyces rimosus R6-500]QST85942.1 hypothetical protein SRIM_016050 [Streptomyces rimosus subsp. rimosus ATCC 10970]QTL91825.1 hypothetical protein FMM49_25330 [Streptomyces rimosus subsp. rimosus]